MKGTPQHYLTAMTHQCSDRVFYEAWVVSLHWFHCLIRSLLTRCRSQRPLQTSASCMKQWDNKVYLISTSFTVLLCLWGRMSLLFLSNCSLPHFVDQVVSYRVLYWCTYQLVWLENGTAIDGMLLTIWFQLLAFSRWFFAHGHSSHQAYRMVFLARHQRA